jgi:hypothetical protein
VRRAYGRGELLLTLTSSFSVASWYDPSLAGAMTITGIVLETVRSFSSAFMSFRVDVA